MIGQIIEITKPGYSLKKSYGFFEIFSQDEQVGKIPLDDILTVIVSVPGCSISTALINELCNRNIPLVICGQNFLPTSITIALNGYSRQHGVMHSQTKLKQPRKNQAWKKIVKAKIINQAKVLSNVGKNDAQLNRLAKQVKSGDRENCEAQAARYYWQKLFGSDFRRRHDSDGLNSALNYSYAIVRSCIARAVVATGLHPTLGIHHKNPTNAFNLVDDIMEPFRPIADYMVWRIGSEELAELDTSIKAKLASITTQKIPLLIENTFEEESPLSLASVKVCKSFADYCLGKTSKMLLPSTPKPLDYIIP